MNRRRFLKASLGAAAATAAFGRFDLRALAARCYVATPPSNSRLVVINLEGGFDALAMLRPTSGTAAALYSSRRPILAPLTTPIPLAGVGGQGLHPSLAVIQSEFAAGKCAIVQKAGLPAPQLSHFESREVMARGRANTSNPDRRGWIGRLADLNFTSNLAAVGVGVPANRILESTAVRPVTITSVANFVSYIFQSTSETNQRRAVLDAMVAQGSSTDARIVAAARPRALAAPALVSQVAAAANVVPAGNYGDPAAENLARSLPEILKLIATPAIGSRVFYTATGDFDTHGYEESTTQGSSKPTLTARLNAVMQALGAFIADLKSPAVNKWNETTIVLYTEFGRRISENQTRGTDHGHGAHMFVLGGGVLGGLKGQAVSDTDLANTNENLPVTIDYRSVWKKVIDDWLGLNGAAVFDDFTPLPGEPAFTLF